MSRNEQQYRLVTSRPGMGETSELFKTVSDGAALSKCLTRACEFAGTEATWELFFVGAHMDEPLAKIHRYSDRSISVTEVNV